MMETYRYATVEAAIASVFFIPAESMGAFRARITNLRRFGITPAAPRKGAPVEYSFQAVAVLAYCISLVQFGLEPASVKTFLEITGLAAVPYLLEDEAEDMIFCFHANEMSRQFADNMGTHAHVSCVVKAASQVNYIELERSFHSDSLVKASPHYAFLGSRLCLLNLSDLRRRLIAALDMVSVPIKSAVA